MEDIVLASISLISLFAGGGLAVLVYRLPLMLQFTETSPAGTHDINSFENFSDLLSPRSHCPDCKQALRFSECLPLCAFIRLRGKCAHCRRKIHLRYPLIECVTVLSSCIVGYRFGCSIQMWSALVLTWGLIVLSGIDCEWYLLPDVLVFPLLWLGLLLNAFHVFVLPDMAILGSCCAYLSLWLLAKVYWVIRGREGMGYGDFKCFALLGAWLGVSSLVEILFIASLLGSIVAWILCSRNRTCLMRVIPFGPCLAIAGWLVLLLEF